MITIKMVTRGLSLILLCCIILIPSGMSQRLASEALRDSVETVVPFPVDSIALPIYERMYALSIEEGNRDLALYAKLYTSYFNGVLGNTLQSEEETEEAFEFAKDTIGISLSNLALAYQWMQQLERQRGNLTRALDINKKYIQFEQEQGVNNAELGLSYMELGSGYRIIGDYENAITYPTQAIDLFLNAHDSLFLGKKDKNLRLCRAYQIRGLAHKDLEDYSNSISDYQKSIDYLIDSKYLNTEYGIKLSIDCYSRLAHVLLLDNQLDRASITLKKIPAFLKKERYNEFRYYELLALLHLKQNNPQKALFNIQKAVDICSIEWKDNKESPEFARLKMIQGDCFFVMDSLHTALKHYQKGLQYFDKKLSNGPESNPDVSKFPEGIQPLQLLEKKADCLMQLYTRQKEQKYLSYAIETYQKAIELLGKKKQNFVNEGSKYRVVELSSKLFQKALDANYLLYEISQEDSIFHAIFSILEKNKAEILFQNINSKYNLLSSELSQEVIDEGIEIKTNISYYSKLLTEAELSPEPNPVKIEKLKDKLFKLNESLVFYDQNVKESFPEFYAFKKQINAQTSLEEIKSALSTNQMLMEFFQTKNYLYILSLGKEKIALRKESWSHILPMIDTFYHQISNPPSENSLDKYGLSDLSMRLSKVLVLNDPIFDSSIKKLIIVADGVLTKLPFESLLVHPDGKYLIEQCVVSYNYSANQFYHNKQNPTIENPKILSITPSFEGSQSDDRSCYTTKLGALPYAQKETEYLQSEFEGKFLFSDSANTENLKLYFQGFPIIHLATHACINEENPMLSQIHFSDGALTNFDVQNLNARPELVILSACNTASGQVIDGEGLIGLSRGFFEAGVKGMQSSLWAINDKSSSEIVKGMYTHLKAGKSKSEALQRSKIDYLNSADKLRSHPYYWAAMIHIGDDKPFEFTSPFYTYLVSGIILLVLISMLFFFLKKRPK